MIVQLLLANTLLAQRDPIKWPFSKTSIWNMPIHKDAKYVPATLKYPKFGLTPDQDILILKPNSPMTKIYTNYAGWDDSKDRCIVQGPLLFSAPIPVSFTVSKDNWLPGMPNAGVAVLMPDGRTIKQTQPFARCTAGSDATSQYLFKDQDIYGDGYYGAHGGSGLSAIGGTLRLGELVPGGIIRHVMKINVCANLNLALNNDGTPGYRWPAANADSYAVDRYRGKNPAMEIGSLLAIPDSLNIDSIEFETEAGKILATAFQNYGAYIVDDSYLDVMSMETEFSPDGRMIDEFKQKWGFDFGSNWDPKDTPWTRDFKRIIEVLCVVDNNTATTIGGGQTNDFQNRLAPMAPDLVQPNAMRGTPMILGKSLPQSVAFAQNVENWKTIQNNGYNTIRVCWVDPWYKDHSLNNWTVNEVLPYLDKCVENAISTGMNIIINFHNVGAQQEFDKTYQFALENEFWNAIALRYKDNDLVYYELANEPTFTMSDYLKPEFKETYLKIYNNIRTLAPNRQILLFSFNTIASDIVNVVENYKDKIDWKYTTVAYHMYNSTSSANVKTLMANYPVLCTEWNYNFVSQRPDFDYIKKVDGYKENAETLEKLYSGWIDWRDWDDITLNELVDTLITDARAKNYWWGKPVAGLSATGISLSDRKLELVSGKSKNLIAFPLPALAEDQKINWTSNDTGIVIVDQNGLVTAVSSRNETATITAITNDGGFTSTCEVSVLASEAKMSYPDGIPTKIPGNINATYYDQGGEGVGYHDMTTKNDGDGVRKDQGVDTAQLLPEGTIGGIVSSEWVEYTIEVLQDGNYTFEILFASAGRYGKFHLEFDGVDKSGPISVLSTGSYSKFATTKITGIALKKGVQVMRISFDYAEYNMGTISAAREIPSGIVVLEAKNKATIFPTPTCDQLYISGNERIKNYSIFSTPGQILKQGDISENQSIDVKYLAKGNYFIRLEGKDFIQTEKFIKL